MVSMVVLIPRTPIGGGAYRCDQSAKTKLEVVSKVTEMAAIGQAVAYTGGAKPRKARPSLARDNSSNIGRRRGWCARLRQLGGGVGGGLVRLEAVRKASQ